MWKQDINDKGNKINMTILITESLAKGKVKDTRAYTRASEDDSGTSEAQLDSTLTPNETILTLLERSGNESSLAWCV